MINGPVSKKTFLKGKYLGITEFLASKTQRKNVSTTGLLGLPVAERVWAIANIVERKKLSLTLMRASCGKKRVH